MDPLLPGGVPGAEGGLGLGFAPVDGGKGQPLVPSGLREVDVPVLDVSGATSSHNVSGSSPSGPDSPHSRESSAVDALFAPTTDFFSGSHASQESSHQSSSAFVSLPAVYHPAFSPPGSSSNAEIDPVTGERRVIRATSGGSLSPPSAFGSHVPGNAGLAPGASHRSVPGAPHALDDHRVLRQQSDTQAHRAPSLSPMMGSMGPSGVADSRFPPRAPQDDRAMRQTQSEDLSTVLGLSNWAPFDDETSQHSSHQASVHTAESGHPMEYPLAHVNAVSNKQPRINDSPSFEGGQAEDAAVVEGEESYNGGYGEHPNGEHPSRTLFVRNINSNVEDKELLECFEKYGAIRNMYTQCKHRGFVMITFNDIRHARDAMREEQGRVLRRRKLDIHFSIPKENPSEKDQNQGTLVVFNLDPSTTSEEVREIFQQFGEVKEVRETPNKKFHKFVEFFDTRNAERAMEALNKTEIRGKTIKIELSRPGGARKVNNNQQPHRRGFTAEAPPALYYPDTAYQQQAMYGAGVGGMQYYHPGAQYGYAMYGNVPHASVGVPPHGMYPPQFGLGQVAPSMMANPNVRQPPGMFDMIQGIQQMSPQQLQAVAAVVEERRRWNAEAPAFVPSGDDAGTP